MFTRGDTERQAVLRNRLLKKGERLESDPFIIKIQSILQSRMRLLDVGCGTAHIVQALAKHHKDSFFVGFDISPAMLKIAKENVIELQNIVLVEGDGLISPFVDCSFDTVITRLAEYSPSEAYRVVKKGGHFLEYGLGPEADKEIVEFFTDRIDMDNFFFPRYPEKWKQEIYNDVKDIGFAIKSIDDYKENEYYQNTEKLMDLIEMVPLVNNFDRIKDRRIVEDLSVKYMEKKGIKITWHYYILHARRL